MKDIYRRKLRQAHRDLEQAPEVTVSHLPRPVRIRAKCTFKADAKWSYSLAVVGEGDVVAFNDFVDTHLVKIYRPYPNFSLLKQLDAGVACYLVARVNNSLIATVDEEYSLAMWDINSGEILSRVTVCSKRHDLWTMIAVGGDSLIIGDSDGNLHIITYQAGGRNLQRSKTVRNVHTDGINDIQSYGRYFAASSYDSTVSVWDSQERRCIALLPAPGNAKSADTIDLDEHHLVSAEDGRICVYSKVDGEFRLARIIRCAFQPDEEIHPCLKLLSKDYLIVGGVGDGILTILNLKTGAAVSRIKLTFATKCWVDVTADGRLIASSTNPHFGEYAMIDIKRPEIFVDALQARARSRYGTKPVKATRRKGNRVRAILGVSALVVGMISLVRSQV